jgi:hypothetical protein
VPAECHIYPVVTLHLISFLLRQLERSRRNLSLTSSVRYTRHEGNFTRRFRTIQDGISSCLALQHVQKTLDVELEIAFDDEAFTDYEGIREAEVGTASRRRER